MLDDNNSTFFFSSISLSRGESQKAVEAFSSFKILNFSELHKTQDLDLG